MNIDESQGKVHVIETFSLHSYMQQLRNQFSQQLFFVILTNPHYLEERCYFMQDLPRL